MHYEAMETICEVDENTSRLSEADFRLSKEYEKFVSLFNEAEQRRIRTEENIVSNTTDDEQVAPLNRENVQLDEALDKIITERHQESLKLSDIQEKTVGITLKADQSVVLFVDDQQARELNDRSIKEKEHFLQKLKEETESTLNELMIRKSDEKNLTDENNATNAKKSQTKADNDEKLSFLNTLHQKKREYTTRLDELIAEVQEKEIAEMPDFSSNRGNGGMGEAAAYIKRLRQDISATNETNRIYQLQLGDINAHFARLRHDVDEADRLRVTPEMSNFATTLYQRLNEIRAIADSLVHLDQQRLKYSGVTNDYDDKENMIVDDISDESIKPKRADEQMKDLNALYDIVIAWQGNVESDFLGYKNSDFSPFEKSNFDMISTLIQSDSTLLDSYVDANKYLHDAVVAEENIQNDQIIEKQRLLDRSLRI